MKTNLETIQITSKNLTKLTFAGDGLIPAIIQDDKTKEILMFAFMNLVSLKKTLKEGKACFWSRSRKKLWVKGESSGNFLFVKSVACDCDCDCLLVKVNPVGPACHTNEQSCFYRKIKY